MVQPISYAVSEKYSVNQKPHTTCVPSREPSIFSLDISPSHSSAELKTEKSDPNRSSVGTPYKTEQKKKDEVSKQKKLDVN